MKNRNQLGWREAVDDESWNQPDMQPIISNLMKDKKR
jgi:hypothetical protein